MGVTRRLQHLHDDVLQPWFVFAAIGALIIAGGIGSFLVGIVVSILKRDQLRVDGDPWGGRTLEWSTTSPPPHYNFAFTPVVHDLDAWYDMKQRGFRRPESGFKPIHMPRNTGAGVIISLLAAAFGFAMIWYIWWLAAVSFVGLLAVSIGHTFNYRRDYYIQPDEVERTERAHALTPAAA
jgi:cytochrome o ubiquinol oxidase subunit 1